MNFNRRTLLATGAAAATTIVAGGAWWLLKTDDAPKGASSRIDLLAGAYTGPVHTTDPLHFVMLSLEGGMPDTLSMELRFFELDGSSRPLPTFGSITLENLITGERDGRVGVRVLNGAWILTQNAIRSSGWWQLRAVVDGHTATWTFLVPDPNLTGFDTPPAVDTDPDAQAMLSATLNTLVNRSSMRWWQWLSGGNGTVILSRFSITTPASNGLPPSFENVSLLAGRIPLDGTAPSFQENGPRTVTIGDEGQRYAVDASPEAINAVQYLPIEEYDTTYAGRDGVHFGITAEIGGRSCQLVAFHLPEGIEAWLAFWIDIETLELRELYMHSVNHYMHWVYYDLDAPFELAF